MELLNLYASASYQAEDTLPSPHAAPRVPSVQFLESTLCDVDSYSMYRAAQNREL